MQKILVLGGTQFIGRNLVEELLKNPEVEITLFNRQKTGSDLFPKVKKIKGDRETDSIIHIGRTDWDYVIDLSCYYPAALENTLGVLPKSVKKYIFISSCSAYDNQAYKEPLKSEETPILTCTNEQRIDRTTDSYGQRKAECERILEQSGQNHVILRPALVYGKYDVTDRCYYWLYLIKSKAQVLLPDNGQKFFSTTYVTDLVKAITSCLTSITVQGAFNVITTPQTSLKKLVVESEKILEKYPKKLNAPAEFLKNQNIAEWTGMPLWIDGNHFTYSNEKMLQSGLSKPTEFIRSLKETIDYFEHMRWPEPQYGISEQKRIELINLL